MNKRIISVIFLIVALFFSSCYVPVTEDAPKKVSDEAVFHFIDVGQGDSILIQSDDKNILIDAGICALLY